MSDVMLSPNRSSPKRARRWAEFFPVIERLIVVLLFGVLPVLAAAFAIYLPFRRYRGNKREVLLIFGILNAVFGGLSTVNIVVMFVIEPNYGTLVPHGVILIGLIAALVVGRGPKALRPSPTKHGLLPTPLISPLAAARSSVS